MKTSLKTTALAALFLAASGPTLRADIDDMIGLALYADQLIDHGIGGNRFVELVDERYWGLYPSTQHPGMGSHVQELHARGLRGRALADAIHAEQARRGIGAMNGKSHGNGNVKIKPLPPGQAKKYGLQPVPGPPGQLKMKPKDKAFIFGNGKGNGKKNK